MRFVLMCLFVLDLVANEPKLLLLEKYKDQNISGWLMSEKLDGIRAYWDGERLLTRGGKEIHAPKWFTKNFPSFELDGELWSKRGEFEFVQGVVMDKNPSDGWHKITYNIFEVPHQKGSLKKRLHVLGAYLKTHKLSHVRIIEQFVCKGRLDLDRFFKAIIKKNGEGVVLRDPKAPYIAKRTKKALKLKSFDDAECKVTKHYKGKGKYKNVLGSFGCELFNGVEFKIGSGLSDKQRRNPPKIGQIVSFKHQGLTKKGKPRFPIFLRVRKINNFKGNNK